MTHTHTVSIAGAGLAGLAAGAAMAQRGFDVRIFERSREPREFGAGIYLKENSLTALDRLGVGRLIEKMGVRLRSVSLVDERLKTIINRDVTQERVVVVLRADLHQALRDTAEAAGAELRTGQTITEAHPDGRLVFADGQETRSDVVVAADGVRSRVRESLGLTKSYRMLEDGATRLLIPREEEPYSTEYWAGNKRVGVAPCSADLTYVFMIGPEREHRCRALPVDTGYWLEAFPHLEGVLRRIGPDGGVHHPHEHVVCKEWVAGRVAIIGDAAHAQPPNFGQGAGLAIAAAWELARTVAEPGDVEDQLLDWERRVRPGADTVQWLTTLYSHLGYYWPSPALAARAELFHWLSVLPLTARSWEFWWRGGTWAPRPGLRHGPRRPA